MQSQIKLEKLERITDELESRDYKGIDANLTISLGEYNIIVRPVWLTDEDRTYKAIYKVHYDHEYYCVQCFEGRWIADLINDCVDSGFLGWIGADLESWSQSPIVMILFDLMQYHGHLNIFGDPYNAMTLDQLYNEVVLS